MNAEDAVRYGIAVHETIEVLLRDGRIEDKKLREMLRINHGAKRSKMFVERMVVLGLLEADPIGIRLYFQPLGTRDRR